MAGPVSLIANYCVYHVSALDDDEIAALDAADAKWRESRAGVCRAMFISLTKLYAEITETIVDRIVGAAGVRRCRLALNMALRERTRKTNQEVDP